MTWPTQIASHKLDGGKSCPKMGARYVCLFQIPCRPPSFEQLNSWKRGFRPFAREGKGTNPSTYL